MKRKIITGALVALAAVLGAGTAHADPWQDDTFVKVLANYGITFPSVRQASRIGWGICGEAAHGDSMAQITADVMAATGLTADLAQRVVWEAGFDYCPHTRVPF